MNYIIENHKCYYTFNLLYKILWQLLEISGYNNNKGNIYGL